MPKVGFLTAESGTATTSAEQKPTTFPPDKKHGWQANFSQLQGRQAGIGAAGKAAPNAGAGRDFAGQGLGLAGQIQWFSVSFWRIAANDPLEQD